MFLHGCSDHQNQLFCLFELRKKASLALRIESRVENIFSIGINCMSLAVWLGEDRKCYAAVEGLDLSLGFNIYGTRCSRNRSFNGRLVSPITAVTVIESSR